MTTKEDIIVLAKAIPAISPVHGEITCVAGIGPDNKWRRLHPVPTRLLGQSYFMKFDIIQVEIDQWKGQHPRPEDRWLVKYIGKIGSIGKVGNKVDWKPRRSLILNFLDKSVRDILSSGRSLGIVKPEILDFYKDANGRCRYKFKDTDRSQYDLVCREWEATALDKGYPNNFLKVRQKFLDWMQKRDTYFVIGTTTGTDPTKMVVAVLYPPKLP